MLDTIDNPFLQAPTTLRPCIWLAPGSLLSGLFMQPKYYSPDFSLLLWVTAPYPCVISMQSSHLSFCFPAALTWLPVATSSRTHFVCVPHLVSFRTITLFKVLQLAPLSAVYRCLRSAASTPTFRSLSFDFYYSYSKDFLCLFSHLCWPTLPDWPFLRSPL